MARIRSVKPDYWWDTVIDDLDDTEALAFIALWNICDDDGRHKYSPREIEMKIPRKSFRGMWEAMLERFTEARLIVPYVVGESKYFHIRTWFRHQRVNRPTLSSIPAPPNGDPIRDAVKSSTNTAVPMNEGIPYEDIINLWNEILGKELPNVKFDPKDTVLLVMRSAWLAYTERQDLDWWKKYFRMFLKSDFLMGRSRLKFRAQLRWVLLPDNMDKILSGYYDNHDPGRGPVDRFKKGK